MVDIVLVIILVILTKLVKATGVCIFKVFIPFILSIGQIDIYLEFVNWQIIHKLEENRKREIYIFNEIANWV